MKLLFKQRLFSWFDSYDIYDDMGKIVFIVKGQLSWGHCLHIYNIEGTHIGTVKEEVFTLLPRFEIYDGETRIGEIKKEFTFFKPKFTLDFKDWQVNGNFLEWDYEVKDTAGSIVMQANKQWMNLTDTYVLDILREEDAIYCLMIVLAIDAAKCSQGS